MIAGRKLLISLTLAVACSLLATGDDVTVAAPWGSGGNGGGGGGFFGQLFGAPPPNNPNGRIARAIRT